MVRMNLIKSWAGGILAALVFSLLTGCGTTGPKMDGGTLNQAPPPLAQSEGRFHVGDLVIVTFSGLSEKVLPPHEERVKEDGSITLSQIGSVKAEGKTSGELQKEIRSKYVDGRYFPEGFNVTVKGQERYFFVKGEVNGPRNYVWSEGMTVLKAIASAGDFNDFASRKKVTVTRVDGRQFKVNCVKAQRDPKLDLPVYPGDTIDVPRSAF